ncbi:MAG: alkaline phosphatase family protein [Candidatus Aenigmatarchaeota archaeon]
MMPVLSVFIDSLKPENIELMDFLKSFENMARVKTELPSYSNTCHASMYTGVYPNKHKHFFIWKYSPKNSPFRSFSRTKFYKLIHSHYAKYLFYASICKLRYGIVPYGYLSFAGQSIECWSNFDFQTVRFWGEPDMKIGTYPTIFKILSDAAIKYQVIWKPNGSLNKVNLEHPPKLFTYVFIGHMDPITHYHGPDSTEAKKKLKEIDKLLEKLYFNFKRAYDEFFFVVFSDHGQSEIKERVNLYSFFKDNGKDLKNYIHFLDSCYARFWFKDDAEKEEVEKVLTKLKDKGFILRKEVFKKYHAEMPNEYGNLIFYLDEPYVFDIVNPKEKFAHGYLPDNPDLDGVCISNKRIKGSYIKLQDIAPSILQALGLETPKYIDGEPVWK